MSAVLWSAVLENKYFFVPENFSFSPGQTLIKTGIGVYASVAAECLTPFEITEEQARRIAKEQLGEALGELKTGIDEKLAEWREELEDFKQRPVTETSPVTPDAGPALLDFLKQLPRVIGQSLSGEEQRTDAARGAMAKLQRRLRDAGIDVDDRFGQFADRLAGLREEVAKEKPGGASERDEPPDKS